MCVGVCGGGGNEFGGGLGLGGPDPVCGCGLEGDMVIKVGGESRVGDGGGGGNVCGCW